MNEKRHTQSVMVKISHTQEVKITLGIKIGFLQREKTGHIQSPESK